MSDEQQTLRDWHRLFGLLLTDFFTNSPFVVEVERDMSVQQQFLDVVIVRRGQGQFADRLPDGMDKLETHNLITFKSHHEALNSWAMKEFVGYSVAYRKLVSPSPSELLPEEEFRLDAVCARFPANLSGRVPWKKCQDGVYDCSRGTDTIRVIVAGELPLETHNAPFHLFSASQGLISFGQDVYEPRSDNTSTILGQLFERLKGEGFAMYTMKDFQRDLVREYFPKLTRQEQEEVLRAVPPEARLAGLTPQEQEELLQTVPPEKRLEGLPPEELLAGLSEEQIRKYLDQLTASRKTSTRKPRRKKK
jgi:hypothetical protein